MIRYQQKLEKRFGPYEKNPSLHDRYLFEYLAAMKEEDELIRQSANKIAIERAEAIRKQEEEKKEK